MAAARRRSGGPAKRGRTLEERLSRDDWAEAALKALVRTGLKAINVLSLSKELGVARGSFYWHFENRAALLETALEMWEQRSTHDYIEQLETLEEPRDRLNALITDGFADRHAGRMFTALSGATSEPSVQEAIARALAARMTFAKRTYRQLGFSMRNASHHAMLVNEVYIGLWHVDRVCPFAEHGLDPSLTLKSHLAFVSDLLLPQND